MKRIAAVVGLTLIGIGCQAERPTLERRLLLLPGAASVKVIDAEDGFSEAYELRLTQPLDHGDPDAGTFEQRIIIEHRGFDRPVVLVTEGYDLGENRVAELAEMLNANEVRMEHRFAGGSAPENPDWELLTIAQSAADAHRLRELLSSVYPGPWVATGWSKGGQTAVIYRWLYPDDVAATVAYDAPLPMALEDPRIDEHLAAVGTPECRARIAAFQRALLEDKNELLPLFRWYAKGKGWGLSVGEEKVFEYTVLEFPFSYWQYSDLDCDSVPGADADPEAMLDTLLDVVDAGWFADENLDSPSFRQFCTELGFYGYDEAPLADLLSAEDYPLCIYAPAWSNEAYDADAMRRLDTWLRTEATGILSVYGALDPWSAPAIPVGDGLDQLQLWDPNGKHNTFIRTLDAEQQQEARQTLAWWLGLPPEEVGE